MWDSKNKGINVREIFAWWWKEKDSQGKWRVPCGRPSVISVKLALSVALLVLRKLFLRQIGASAASQNVANVAAVKKLHLYGLTRHNTFIHLTVIAIGWHANDTGACQPESESVKFCRLRLQLRLRPKLPTPTDSDSDSDSDSAALLWGELNRCHSWMF